MNAKINLTAVFEEAEEGGYIAYVEEIPGVNTQGETLEEARERIKEVIDLVHARMEHSDGRKTSVPIHSGEKVGIGLLRKILRDTNISRSEFDKLR